MNTITKKNILDKIECLSDIEALSYLTNIENPDGKKYIVDLIKKYNKLIERKSNEQKRLNEMCVYEKKAEYEGYKYIAGIDEVGRGPLVGPVLAACVILPSGCMIEGINDSKQLSEDKRNELYKIIIGKALCYQVGIVDNKKIDEVNIYNATKLAMEAAVANMDIKPDYLLIDAMKLENIDIPQKSIIKGDCKSISIAAASIVAKVVRDKIMTDMNEQYPQYRFDKNKGYGTKEHIDAIKEYGLCPKHRNTFTKNITQKISSECR